MGAGQSAKTGDVTPKMPIESTPPSPDVRQTPRSLSQVGEPLSSSVRGGVAADTAGHEGKLWRSEARHPIVVVLLLRPIRRISMPGGGHGVGIIRRIDYVDELHKNDVPWNGCTIKSRTVLRNSHTPNRN